MDTRTDTDAMRAGISPKAEIRQALIDWRGELMKADPPNWDQILLLAHATWWLAE